MPFLDILLRKMSALPREITIYYVLPTDKFLKNKQTIIKTQNHICRNEVGGEVFTVWLFLKKLFIDWTVLRSVHNKFELGRF